MLCLKDRRLMIAETGQMDGGDNSSASSSSGGSRDSSAENDARHSGDNSSASSSSGGSRDSSAENDARHASEFSGYNEPTTSTTQGSGTSFWDGIRSLWSDIVDALTPTPQDVAMLSAEALLAYKEDILNKLDITNKVDLEIAKENVRGLASKAGSALSAVGFINDYVEKYNETKSDITAKAHAFAGVLGSVGGAVVGAPAGPAGVATGAHIGAKVTQGYREAAAAYLEGLLSNPSHPIDPTLTQADIDLANEIVKSVQNNYGIPEGLGLDVPPVLLDLGSGISLTENSGAAYSWGAGGNRYVTGWASATTGILAYDANNDGTISGRGELALADYVKGAETDLEGLKHFDSNQDGSFDTKDAAWTSFKVWVDANQNGVSDAGELRSLDAADVAAIELKEQRHDKTLGVNVHQGTGRYTTKDGTTRTAVSVALGVDWAKVIEGATGIDLTSGRVPKTTALNTASWKITLNDPGPMTPAMALAAFAAAGSAAAGQPATLVYEGSTFTRDGKGAINVSASVLANHGVFGAKNETSTHTVTAADIVSDAINPARIAASTILLPGVTLDVQNALDRVAASTAGRSTVLFDGVGMLFVDFRIRLILC
jgi:hypothetical protein